MAEITWLDNGQLYGKPETWLGCEVTCGTKQKWSIGITPALAEDEGIEAYKHSLVISMNPKDSSGGTCTGGFKDSDNPFAHKMVATIRRYHNYVLQTMDEVIVVGGVMSHYALSGQGTYRVNLKTLEWGEECIKPKDTDTFSFKVGEPSYPVAAPTHIQPMGDGEPVESDNRAMLLPLIILMGGGVFLLISNWNKKN